MSDVATTHCLTSLLPLLLLILYCCCCCCCCCCCRLSTSCKASGRRRLSTRAWRQRRAPSTTRALTRSRPASSLRRYVRYEGGGEGSTPPPPAPPWYPFLTGRNSLRARVAWQRAPQSPSRQPRTTSRGRPPALRRRGLRVPVACGTRRPSIPAPPRSSRMQMYLGVVRFVNVSPSSSSSLTLPN